MSDRERIAQVAQRKWATVSDSLRSLRGNELCEGIAYFVHQKWGNEQFAQKILAKNLKSCFNMSYIRFIFKKKFEKMSELLIFAHFLFFCEQCEWISHFAQIKWAMWANRSFRSRKMSNHEQFAQVAQRKWAMWANLSFRSAKMSEWVNHSFFWANCSFAHFCTTQQILSLFLEYTPYL